MGGPRTHDAAHILRVIGNRIDPKLRSIPRLELREEKLLRHARPTRGAQSIRQKVAARSWNCANNVTAPRMTQGMKKTSHGRTKRQGYALSPSITEVETSRN